MLTNSFFLLFSSSSHHFQFYCCLSVRHPHSMEKNRYWCQHKTREGRLRAPAVELSSWAPLPARNVPISPPPPPQEEEDQRRRQKSRSSCCCTCCCRRGRRNCSRSSGTLFSLFSSPLSRTHPLNPLPFLLHSPFPPNSLLVLTAL